MALGIAEQASFWTRAFDANNAADPVELFRNWYGGALKTEPADANAVALATASASGIPSVRMVLVKRIDKLGFSFYTNAESRKGQELQENPRAAMCFHWKTQRRQVRIEGHVHELSAEDADSYFHSRARRSQVGAAVSAQSRPLASRDELEASALAFEDRFPGEIPRPAFWKGYVLEPKSMEFWQDGAFRLHDRMLFTRSGSTWEKVRLYP